MNEQIRELAEQAKEYARTHVAECKHYGYYMEDNEYELRFEKKFAELIVRECGNFLKDTLDDHFAAEQLEEHFGVEE